METSKTYKDKKSYEILTSNKSDDQKLYEVFQLLKEDIRDYNSDLYYALLGWKDSHLREFKPIEDQPYLLDECNHSYIRTRSTIPDLEGNFIVTYECKFCGHTHTEVSKVLKIY